MNAGKPPPTTPQTPPAIPAENMRGFGNFTRRRRRHRSDDRRVPGQRADEELRALDEIFEGPALLNMERVKLCGLQFIRCSDWMGPSDPIRLWEWNGKEIWDERMRILWYLEIENGWK